MYLNGKRIVLGVCGGIAAYRVAELARMLMKQGAEVRCVMTEAACEFISPLTFEALTGEEVHRQLFDLTRERNMGHIQLARWADVVLVAPATANSIAKFAHGVADDLLTTLMQVCEAPVLLAPAMNASMWASEATKRNVKSLCSRGMHIIEPASGTLACGEQGQGRLAELQDIIDALVPLLASDELKGQTWVINAGPTVEAWDAVRILTNRASGKLGVAMAIHAAMMGASVTLVAGPGVELTPDWLERINIVSADEMLSACLQRAVHTDVFIGAAAVSDFRFAQSSNEKMKRGNMTHVDVRLLANPDIIAAVAAMPDRPRKVIAFAAETSDLIAHAKEKLARKHVDAIVANQTLNMGKDEMAGYWLTDKTESFIECMSKQAFAREIVMKIVEGK
ncbi:MAG: bifunctional phosphopantothenoylcysteine decarboxylase/phosphopantothenate--cysteine ligase CoaBC [Zetaproteobacteria bacterium CG_4_9_14_3_um_filter_49_83]|nr:MAG: phosphopantothenoylcysteine synthase [Zetaproteobacteria bacterium CG1_02_49_23]PIQ31350.1 MAG: bifunctional phosphopantothenoylcysteine decarboxylase/phosphopantothenate--cysteine ligase CoaBC [Zetaproteobacteria bacterium CG17_big_fil_post_rev_8_21_14_2_50_50_13]PIV31262.1 MAG: bifunctional phosphopantothenoylcysteine decarboxylase/phosphopantothenate--cysteine ligase CoaBC [Zetaproteobacteria bacterium CG02_land_8_20_14_3_00_50_9]PIY55380.1 MAG: bifunctional phosphopantothenoylcystein